MKVRAHARAAATELYAQQQTNPLLARIEVRAGRGGVWRIPPNFDGAKRQPVPRFTVLSEAQLAALSGFFADLGAALRRALVPGAHVFVASNPLLSCAPPPPPRADSASPAQRPG